MEKINVLIKLHRGYGLGDCVQMSAVLRHVVKYRPNWNIDYCAEKGMVVGRGIVNNVFSYGEPYPSSRYDAEVEILLFDTFSNWGDRPNTRVCSCLHERFGLGWDPACGRYQVNVSAEAVDQARTLLKSNRLVAIHYIGESSPTKKNLTHEQARDICRIVKAYGYEPMVLDWKQKCPLPPTDCRKLTIPKEWGGDIEMVCAVIRQCRAFIGIDSGPSKCASSTETPALVIWTGHHPAPFHDPAPNTTHLVPSGYHGLEPVCNDRGVIEFFEREYNVIKYDGLVRGVRSWLMEHLAQI